MQNKVLLKMENKEIFSTLSDIRKMMEKSSKFLSLNGLSAILVGIYACTGAVIAYLFLGDSSYTGTIPMLRVSTPQELYTLTLWAILLIALCLGTVFMMCRRKARSMNQRLHFDHTAQRLLLNFFLPLVAGGVLCLSLISQHHDGLTSSIMLIFYGIALINASAYTYSNTKYLGYAELVLGLADSFAEGYSLLFWVTGFGFFHIIYGILFYLKYDRKRQEQRIS